MKLVMPCADDTRTCQRHVAPLLRWLVKRGLGCALLLGAAYAFGARPAGAADPDFAATFPTASSKKGLQVELLDDALQLGIQHATFNVDLCRLVDPQLDPANPSWEREGRRFHFDRAAVAALDQQIKTLSDRGVLVYLILLAYQSHDAEVNRVMLHPRYDSQAPNRLSAFNTQTPESEAWFAATCEFMAARWSQANPPFGRVVGYILGNEVNSHWWWYNMGRVTLPDFVADYQRTARIAQTAIRRHSSWARLYLSLEHHWNLRYPAADEQQGFAGREFLASFAALAREQGDFDWHLAFHPYPENLFEPRFWLDQSAVDSVDTPRITFKNLPQLTHYLQQPEMQFQGQPRRIILSEQGFHTPEQPDGETVQAAAYCYAYRQVAVLEGIDAFILHRHVDHPHEGGLHLGLRAHQPGAAEPRPKKRIYECFRLADTPQWESAFEFALPIVGLERWP